MAYLNVVTRALLSRSATLDPARNLAYEQGLLDAVRQGELRLHLYRNEPCVVIGRNQNPWTEASGELPVFRRISGGGAVVHGEACLCWAFVAERSAFTLDDGLDFVIAALRRLDLAPVADERGALWLDGRKISGSARAFRHGGVLVHGTLLLAADPDRIARTLSGLSPAWSRAVSSRRSPVAGLREFAPRLDTQALEAAFLGEARERWGTEAFRPSPEAPGLEALVLAHRSFDWIYGETPAFGLDLAAGAWRGRARVESGRIAAIECPPGLSPPPALLCALDRPFDPATLHAYLPAPAEEEGVFAAVPGSGAA